MNNLKFRAWHKEEKRMMFVRGIDATEGNEMTYFHCFWDLKNDEGENLTFMPSDWFKADEVILMQSTGLKDLNHKELFVGDVIHCYEPSHTGVIVFGEILGQFSVKLFKLEGRKSYFSKLEEGLGLDDYPPCFEIIGNIYEQPELLGGGL